MVRLPVLWWRVGSILSEDALTTPLFLGTKQRRISFVHLDELLIYVIGTQTDAKKNVLFENSVEVWSNDGNYLKLMNFGVVRKVGFLCLEAYF